MFLGAHIDLEDGNQRRQSSQSLAGGYCVTVGFYHRRSHPSYYYCGGSHRVYIAATVIAVLVALCITGYLSAVVSNSSRLKVMIRIIVGGALAMAITYTIGRLFGGIVH